MRIDRNSDPVFIDEIYSVIKRLGMEFEFDHLTVDKAAHFREADGQAIFGFLLKPWWYDSNDRSHGSLAAKTNGLLKEHYPELFL